MTAKEKVGVVKMIIWVRSARYFSYKSLIDIHQPDLNPSIKRIYSVANFFLRIKIYIIKKLRQLNHLLNNNPSVLNIGWEHCIAGFIVAEYLFIISNNPTNLLILNDSACMCRNIDQSQLIIWFPLMPQVKQILCLRTP